MAIADLFVGSLSILLGAAALLVAAFNSDTVFQLPKAQAMQRRWGRKGARIVLAVLGVLLVTAGVAVIVGFAPGWLEIPFLQTP